MTSRFAALTFACSGALALLFHGPQARAQVRALSLEEATQQALRANADVLAGRARADAGEHAASSLGRRMLPSVRVADEFQRYDKAFAVSFPSGMPMMPGAPSPGFVVRDRETNTFSASVDQPVLGLIRLNQERAAQSRTAQAGRARVRAGEAELRRAVAEGFLAHFEALALEQIALSSTRELSDQVTIARARLSSGVITNADVLRVESALANAQQQSIGARAQAAIARAAVLTALGADANDESIVLGEPTALLDVAREPAPAYGAAVATATRERPELQARQQDVEAAEAAAKARAWALLPDVNLEAAYVHITGQQFAPKDSAYVGVRAQWAIWEWGATEEQRRAARAQAEAARQDLVGERRQIANDVAASLAQDQAARAAVEAAGKAVTGAEEAYRVTNAQVQAGAATTTDLLEAQSALTQARLNLTRARYGLGRARVGLSYATGS